MLGDIFVSSQGSARTQRLVLLHERVHAALTPKLSFLRDFRVSLRINGYTKSHLLRYAEEALAEALAQLGVNGPGAILDGIRFPVRNGYVTPVEDGGGGQRDLHGTRNRWRRHLPSLCVPIQTPTPRMTRNEAIARAKELAHDKGWPFLEPVIAHRQASGSASGATWEVLSNAGAMGTSVVVMINDESGAVMESRLRLR